MTDNSYNTYKPEWVPLDGGGEAFASQIMTGVDDLDTAKGSQSKAAPAAKLSLADYVDGILAGNRMILARAITIVESNAPKHFALSQELVQRLLPYSGNSVRVGITGVPGAGKSTFIEALGCYLCRQGKKVAVLAVDPSSSLSKGSILGDKTRMENLAKEANAFIRPSPSGGTLGGVTRKSRETILLCEAAGYDTVLLETVGVGQSETTVRSMVDFFLVLVITGAGDDLQGIKKGIIELADAILVNKADGDNQQKALVTKADYNQILHYLRPATEGWTTKAYSCSSLTGEGIEDIWQVILNFIEIMQENGQLQSKRQQQTLSWVKQVAEEHIRNIIKQNPRVQDRMLQLEQQLLAGSIPATLATQNLITIIEEELKK
ncbi:MAG: methylmalonyl Co-A mutase-associated GTPase MeaB [Clostridiales bacterium]|jgi:LAO/AO transport system kinase|nr:methylmalonyl Co-A mutase-associated GTPase MeaB [Clostridiales bacterium]MDR2711861.1 methylmalonyl Co-A mutase-associated GTPase MeaB [Clostridiales bacterium]